MAVASGFEADAIHCAVHLWNFEDLGNLIADRGILGDIDGLAPKTPGLRQPLGDEVAYNHDGGSQQLARGRAGEPNRTCAGNVDRRSRADPRADCAVIARWQNVRETC